ncbi:cobalamin biosynthesis protein CobD [Sphingomonas fennica]|uniref:Cobalamin biosynthesis protein CobD n=2 Tax=Edaphosphingomonas fennica TaxID=114404 RepID=A0A2T4HRW6_9SPHN|nr:cobalamin biosynthesis protein CobD [Sphingomonas fennica]
MPPRSIGSTGPWRMASGVACVALAIDALIGWPPALYRRIGHPVGLFARVIDGLEGRWNWSGRSDAARRAAGIAAMALLIGGTFLVALAIEQMLWAWLGRWGWIGVAAAAAPGLAARSLHDHVRPVASRLAAGDLAGARRAVGMIVGRDTGALDEAGVARAAIESLSESFCDGVAAPFFWLLLLGLPGIWTYKAINTADSLIGHREERCRAYGWAAARIDDAANFLPARLAGLLICLAGMDGWRVMARDHRHHASPNAGWPEAAMAGALGLRLGGPIAYDGIMQDKPWIGGGRAAATAADIARALRIYIRACLLLWIAGAIAWAA